MTTLYPAQIDTVITLPTVIDNFTPISGDSINRLRDAIIAIESELGVKPSAIYGTVRARLDAIEHTINTGGDFIISGDLVGSSGHQTVTGLQNRPVSSTAPTLGQTLVWQGSAWSPGTSFVSGGDLSGSPTTQLVIGIQGRPISSTAPTTGQTLVWGGSNWAPGPSFNPAGDLAGSVSNQTVTGIQTRPVSSTAPTTGQTLIWGGSSWAPGPSFNPAGDLSGSVSNQTVIGIRGTPVSSTAPITNQVLVFNGTNYVPFPHSTVLKTVAGASVATGAGVVVTGTTARTWATTNTGKKSHGIAIGTGTTGQTIPVQTYGLLDPSIRTLGAGAAVAVGFNSSGLPVRVTDPTCVPGLDRLGWCDTSGQIFIEPTIAPNFNVLDYGAVGDGVTDDLPAFQAAQNAIRNSLVSGINQPLGVIYVPSRPNTSLGYFLGGNLEIEVPCRITGTNPNGGAAQSTMLVFAGGCGIILHSEGGGSPNGGDATGAAIDHIMIQCSDMPASVGQGGGAMPDWQALHAYNVGDRVRLHYTQAMWLECIRAGTSGATEPVVYENIENLNQESFNLYRGKHWAAGQTLNYGDWVTATDTVSSITELFFHIDSGLGQINPWLTGSVEPIWGTTPGTQYSFVDANGHTVLYTTWSAPRIHNPTDFDVNAAIYDPGPTTGVLWAKKTSPGILIRAFTVTIEHVVINDPQNYGITLAAHILPPDVTIADNFLISKCEINRCGGGIWTTGGEVGAGTCQFVNVYTRQAIDIFGAPFAQHSTNSHCFLQASFLGNNYIGCTAQNDTRQNNHLYQNDPRVFNYDYWCTSGTNSSIIVGCYSEGGNSRMAGTAQVFGGTMAVQENNGGIGITEFGAQNFFCEVNVLGYPISDATKPELQIQAGIYPYYASIWRSTDDNTRSLAWLYAGSDTPGWWIQEYSIPNTTTLNRTNLISQGVSTLRSGDLGGLLWNRLGNYRGNIIGSASFEFSDLGSSTEWVRGGVRHAGDAIWRPDVANSTATKLLDITTSDGYEGSTWQPNTTYMEAIAASNLVANPNAHPGSCIKPIDTTNLNRFKIRSISGTSAPSARSGTIEPTWTSAPNVGNTVTDTNSGDGTTITWINVGAAPSYGQVDVHTSLIKYTSQPETLWIPQTTTLDGTHRARVDGYSDGYTTTGNLTTTIHTFALPANTLSYVNCVVLAFETSGTGSPDAAVFKLSGSWYRTNGSPVQVKAPIVDETNANANGTAWTAVLLLSGNNVLVRATGDIGKNIKWELIRQVVEAT